MLGSRCEQIEWWSRPYVTLARVCAFIFCTNVTTWFNLLQSNFYRVRQISFGLNICSKNIARNEGATHLEVCRFRTVSARSIHQFELAEFFNHKICCFSTTCIIQYFLTATLRMKSDIKPYWISEISLSAGLTAIRHDKVTYSVREVLTIFALEKSNKHLHHSRAGGADEMWCHYSTDRSQFSVCLFVIRFCLYLEP